MTLRVLVLHAYSAENAGDGLLVRETLALLQEAFGANVDVTLLASRPDTFRDLVPAVYPTVPTKRGWDPETRRILKNIDDFDLAIGVGGGYLRTGTPVEAAKTLLVQGPQLRAAAGSSTPTVYLPQSIGPARFGTRRWFRKTLGKLDVVMARDDRTINEVGGPSMIRVPDLATASVAGGRQPGVSVEGTPVLSIRSVRGKVNPDIYVLSKMLGEYDGYIQSTVGGNDDRPASATLSPRSILERSLLMTPGGSPRVIVAVRLHAALMALAAGHYVVHLAYERKGFGAFGDLGISPWVHSVNTFEPDVVATQVKALLEDPSVRVDYDNRLAAAGGKMADSRARIVSVLRENVAARP